MDTLSLAIGFFAMMCSTDFYYSGSKCSFAAYFLSGRGREIWTGLKEKNYPTIHHSLMCGGMNSSHLPINVGDLTMAIASASLSFVSKRVLGRILKGHIGTNWSAKSHQFWEVAIGDVISNCSPSYLPVVLAHMYAVSLLEIITRKVMNVKLHVEVHRDSGSFLKGYEIKRLEFEEHIEREQSIIVEWPDDDPRPQTMASKGSVVEIYENLEMIFDALEDSGNATYPFGKNEEGVKIEMVDGELDTYIKQQVDYIFERSRTRGDQYGGMSRNDRTVVWLTMQAMIKHLKGSLFPNEVIHNVQHHELYSCLHDIYLVFLGVIDVTTWPSYSKEQDRQQRNSNAHLVLQLQRLKRHNGRDLSTKIAFDRLGVLDDRFINILRGIFGGTRDQRKRLTSSMQRECASLLNGLVANYFVILSRELPQSIILTTRNIRRERANEEEDPNELPQMLMVPQEHIEEY